MFTSALHTFAAQVRSEWGRLDTKLVGACRHQLALLARAPASEPWLRELHSRRPAAEELYRDPDHGFVLLAHAETGGLYRPPHDHGRAWVVYAVQDGAVEMRTFTRVERPDRTVELVQRDSIVVHAGQVQAYLPGDIHDTRCLTDTALLFRFTERDLKVEDRVEHRVARYPSPQFAWTTGT
jgi:hypothetical protein